MAESNQTLPPRFRFMRPFWIGIIIFALGSGPLLATLLLAALGLTKDPNPNPVGFGILAFFTFYPSLALIVAGLVISVSKHHAARKQFDDRHSTNII